MPRLKAILVSALVAASSITTVCAHELQPAAASSSPSDAETLAIATEAYHYFYPLLSMDVTRRQLTNIEAGKMPGRGPANTFSHMRAFPTADFKEVVRPNFDTLYSSAWLDLTAEPIVITAPDTDGRYYLLPMLDMWSDVFAVPGKRTTGTDAGAFVIVGPGWSGDTPAGLERIDAPTSHVWLIGRTQTNGPADYAAVHKVQDAYTLTPLSKWPSNTAYTPAPVAIDPSVDMKTPPKVQVDTMKGAAYFTYAAELLTTNPPHITDWSIVARMRRIGIEPGKPFNASAVDPAILDRAVAAAQQSMAQKAATLARVANGWQMNTDSMGVYGNFYLKRAIVAAVGLGANQPEDAIYPLCVADADGKPLVAENTYVIHFQKDQLPPADAFWSITMYDADGFQVANPINRFAIGDRDALKRNPDGSIDIYIQHSTPGPDRESNWLPAPATGAIGVTMRLYAPRAEALDGRWAPPVVRRMN